MFDSGEAGEVVGGWVVVGPVDVVLGLGDLAVDLLGVLEEDGGDVELFGLLLESSDGFFLFHMLEVLVHGFVDEDVCLVMCEAVLGEVGGDAGFEFLVFGIVGALVHVLME